jgi:RimJ/RimL family protein N-acetyltransferase
VNPLDLQFPEQFESQRLLIRCPRPGDGPLVYEAVCETLSDLRAWPVSLPWAVFEPSVDASENYCQQGHAAFAARRDLPLLLFHKGSGALVGASGLHRMNWAQGRFEVGYWCRRSAQGEGYITEAVQAIAGFAENTLGARRVECFSDERNVSSRKVAERSGFVLESIQARTLPSGATHSYCVYARVS